MRHLAGRDDNWTKVGCTVVVNGHFMAGQMTADGGMVVSFWLLDWLGGYRHPHNDNAKPQPRLT